MRTVIKWNTERDFFSFMPKRRKNADVLPVLAQNKSSLSSVPKQFHQFHIGFLNCFNKTEFINDLSAKP